MLDYKVITCATNGYKIDALRESLPCPLHVVELTGSGADLWLQKPMAMLRANAEMVIWLDADTLVLRNWHRLIRKVRSRFTVFEDVCGADCRNAIGVYARRPVPKITDDELCAAVVGYRKGRDSRIMNTWLEACSWGEEWKYGDQGALLWTLLKLRLSPDPDAGFCFPLPTADRKFKWTVETLRRRYPQVSIMHWAGEVKLWEATDEVDAPIAG